MPRAYIAFGANLSNPRETFLQVAEAMGARGWQVEAVSPLYRSPAWPPGSDAPDYLNAVMAVRTTLIPKALMSALLDIEAELGRRRSTRNAPRAVDLDLIDYAGQVSADPHCTLPHPRSTQRAFVLLPLRDIAPDWRDPVSGQGIDALIGCLPPKERAACRRS